jgi:hypothetical protein
VTRDVGQRFLKDAEDTRSAGALDLRFAELDLPRTRDPGALREALQVPLGGRRQAEIVQYARAQLGHQRARRVEGLADELVHATENHRQRLVTAMPSPRQIHLHAQRGQELAHLVVDLTRQAPALVLPTRLDVARQPTSTMSQSSSRPTWTWTRSSRTTRST